MSDQFSSTEFKKYSRSVRRMHPSFVHHLLLHTRDRIKPAGRPTGKRANAHHREGAKLRTFMARKGRKVAKWRARRWRMSCRLVKKLWNEVSKETNAQKGGE